MNQDILIVGKKDTIFGFKSVGIKTLFWTDKEEIEKEVHSAIQNNIKIIFITEDIFEELKSLIEHYKELLYPIFVPIPSLEGSKGVGYNKVMQLAVEAIGQASFNE